MTRGKNEEREFLKRVDAMLAGQEIAAGEDIVDADVGDDLRGTVEFARKLADLQEGPTLEFSQRLKSRLLIKLTEQDEAARSERSWFSRVLWGSPVWRSAAVSLALVVAVVTVLWRTGMFTGTAGLDTPALETVADQTAERAMAPLAADDMAVAEMADGEAAVAEAPAAEPTAEPDALELSIAGDTAVVFGDFSIELQRGQLWALDIDIEVTGPAGSALSDDDVGVVAWYSYDDGPALEATYTSSRYLADEGLLSFSWTGLEPAPSGAKTLTLTIESVGDLEGPWVYEIPLQD